MKRPLQSMLVLAASAIALVASGCAAHPAPQSQAPASSATSATQPAAVATGLAGSPTETASVSAEATKGAGVSAKALAYAKGMGGADHKGLAVYLVVGGTYGTEADAQAALDKALPLYDDLPAYFIVQRSDSFAGMAPGSFVVVEVHFKAPTEENLEFDRKGFPNAHVVKSRVLVAAPVPVYEDIVGGD